MNNSKQKSFLSAYEKCHEPFLRYCSALAFGKIAKDNLYINSKKIEHSKIQAYEALIMQFNLKRKANKMSKNTIAYGDYQPGSFTGSFYEFKY